MATGAMFDPLVPLLQSNFRTIIPDLRGHGESGDPPGPYDVPSLTADLDAVLEHRLRKLRGPGIFAWGRGRSAAGAYATSGRQKDDVDMHLCLQGAYGGEGLPGASYDVFSPDARQSGGATIQARTNRRNRPEQIAGRLAKGALVCRRRQIIEMIVAEKQRAMRLSNKRLQQSIARLIKALEKELASLDTDIGATVRGSPAWREKKTFSSPFRASVNVRRALCSPLFPSLAHSAPERPDQSSVVRLSPANPAFGKARALSAVAVPQRAALSSFRHWWQCGTTHR